MIEIEDLSRTGGNANSIMMPLRQDMFGISLHTNLLCCDGKYSNYTETQQDAWNEI
jgi:hypothetical protein